MSIAEPIVDSQEWERLNRDALVAELDVLRALIRGEDPSPLADVYRAAAAALGGPGMLDALATEFALTGFERAVLLLAAGQELVSAVGDELEMRTGSPRLTFGTALAVLPGAHWSALAPASPLRSWELVFLDDPRSPAHSQVLVDERVLHHLVGVDGLDSRLEPICQPVPALVRLPERWEDAARELAIGWSAGTVLLRGGRADDCRAVAALAACWTGSLLRELGGPDLPVDAADLARVMRLVERESRLDGCAWLVNLDGLEPVRAAQVARACAGRDGRIVVLTAGRDASALRGLGQPSVEVEALDLAGRAELLGNALLSVRAPLDDLAEVAGVFDLGAAQAAEVASDVAGGDRLWSACRRRSRPEPGGVARLVTPRASWPELVLPTAQLDQLHALVSAVRHRTQVLDGWGFADRSARGLGTTALFAGASGTGKTLAAEVLAHELGLDLLQVDLSQVMSKYIGETEKNLGEVFNAAEQGSAVLLFDEADALFGKRSEVKDSHDRYANLEVGYLLQRVELFRGLAVLTTNARGALDQAFLRRLQIVVTFPYPDAAARVRLWRTAFPPRTPIDIDVDALAQVDVPGGAIAAAALTAAYLAAGRGTEVTTLTVREALNWELAKSRRTVAGS